MNINDAKSLAYKHRKSAVLIVSFDGSGQVAGVSYGMTRPLCTAAGRVLDGIINRLSNGTIYVPDLLKEQPAYTAPSGPSLPLGGKGEA